ncbi:MAG TPA: hypothetical protein VJP02_08250 [Candidatus Sulfotelmatobacter sp.]|nr:hypothetical protein [Candidatus Sulfotelmatobacter sp.]
MKYGRYLVLLSTLTLLFPLSVWARDKNQHSVAITDSVQVGATQLKPGNYKVEWQEAGPVVHVEFVQNGKTVATASGELKMNDDQVIQDDVVIQTTSDHRNVLKEIDFGHQKEALILG